MNVYRLFYHVEGIDRELSILLFGEEAVMVRPCFWSWVWEQYSGKSVELMRVVLFIPAVMKRWH